MSSICKRPHKKFAESGIFAQHFGTYPQLTAWEFLDIWLFLGGMHNRRARLNRVEQALNEVGLYEARNRRSGTFSGGMMRRLGIAQAILTDPEFLIVDEPTVGLDPEERIRFRSILGRLSSDRAILISTHIVGDISSTCEDLAVLDTGHIDISRFSREPHSKPMAKRGKCRSMTLALKCCRGCFAWSQ